MKQIYLVERAMIFNQNELKHPSEWKWSTLYATNTKEEANEDIKRMRKQEVERKKTDIIKCLEYYYRIEEITLY